MPADWTPQVLGSAPPSIVARKDSPQQGLREVVDLVKMSVAQRVPFSPAEVDRAVQSLRNLTAALDWGLVREIYAGRAHEPYKDWARTEEGADAIQDLLKGSDGLAFQQVFQRVLRDGHWEEAARVAAARPPSSKPWVVLITGLNGIRKTTCVYQRWFRELLRRALEDLQPGCGLSEDELPDGRNSFFRQLDYIMAAVANEEFRLLYELQDLSLYATLKDGIFSRYRTIAEMWGAVLVKEARAKRLNVMIETSGRDPGMYGYVDHFFPDSEYRKLVLHFTINDRVHAERSVDTRMLSEMRAGREALVKGAHAVDIIDANAGGPYGSAALKKVEAESEHVWMAMMRGNGHAEGWYKATIAICGHKRRDWSARVNSVEAPYNAEEPDDEEEDDDADEEDDGVLDSEAYKGEEEFVFAPLPGAS